MFEDKHFGGGGGNGGGSGGGSGGDFTALSSAPPPSLPYPVTSGDPAFPSPVMGMPYQPQPRPVSMNMLILMYLD